jgi:hypothetical protein
MKKLMRKQEVYFVLLISLVKKHTAKIYGVKHNVIYVQLQHHVIDIYCGLKE